MGSNDSFQVDTAVRPESRIAEEIRRLERDRQAHADAMAEIDRVLARIEGTLKERRQASGFTSPELNSLDLGGSDRGTFDGRRRRGRFTKTALDSILDFIREKENPSTAEINAHWRAEGRKGTVNVTLLKLLKQGKIRRNEDPSVRGSRYVIADPGRAGQ
jgi:hypothetical protein